MEYNQGTLMEDKLPDNPFLLFKEWINGAQIKDPDYYNAMVLSTVNSQLKADSRVVLLKDFNEEGFVFFSNWESRKGLQIKQNPNVGLNFFWKDWERQVRVQGKIHRLDAADEDDYFATRPFESQIGAWVSKQSEVLSSREEMDNLFVNKQRNRRYLASRKNRRRGAKNQRRPARRRGAGVRKNPAPT